ncbi:hypothetical protein ACFVUS_23985 [Nocardia sp. NPDC058058]|uniref:hypothetical protein n=1 Tax=Nocardia sp. NPDC058058 TaxID=3346317 RepID=UPI0036DDBA84
MDIYSADQWSYSDKLIGSGYQQHEYKWAVVLRGEDPSDKTWPGVYLKWTKGVIIGGRWSYTREAAVRGSFTLTDPEGRITTGEFPAASGPGEGGVLSWSPTSGLCRYGTWNLAVSITLGSSAYSTSTGGMIEVKVDREFSLVYG